MSILTKGPIHALATTTPTAVHTATSTLPVGFIDFINNPSVWAILVIVVFALCWLAFILKRINSGLRRAQMPRRPR